MKNAKNFYIDGAWVAPSAAHDFDVINPSTEEVCETISLGSEADTNAAVAAARASFEAWSQTSKEERIALLKTLSEVYNDRAEEMAQAIWLSEGAGKLRI